MQPIQILSSTVAQKMGTRINDHLGRNEVMANEREAVLLKDYWVMDRFARPLYYFA
jgi:hypothetical protein